MLYISKHVGLDGFGVVDTDDGSEEFIDRTGLFHLEENGVKVHGVGDVYDRSISCIVPYQDPATLSLIQVKTKMLNHVDVRVHNGAVTFICWDSARIRKPVPIRLSDFGTSVEDCIFAENVCSHEHIVTIIVDDKITKVSEFAFRMDEYGWSVEMSGIGKGGLGAVFDLRELTNGDVARAVYEQLDAYAGDSYDHILDSEFRKSQMILGRY